MLAADKVLIVGDFNIHVDNEKDALGSAFIDILNSIEVRQHVSGPTDSRNHTMSPKTLNWLLLSLSLKNHNLTPKI